MDSHDLPASLGRYSLYSPQAADRQLVLETLRYMQERIDGHDFTSYPGAQEAQQQHSRIVDEVIETITDDPGGPKELYTLLTSAWELGCIAGELTGKISSTNRGKSKAVFRTEEDDAILRQLFEKYADPDYKGVYYRRITNAWNERAKQTGEEGQHSIKVACERVISDRIKSLGLWG